MELTIFQHLILGAVQGILEWLPISSSAFIILILSNFFQITDASTLIQAALFLHLGTFLAALIYFRKDVSDLIKAAFNYRKTPNEELSLFNFIVVSTLITALVGLIILTAISYFEEFVSLTGKAISLFVGFLLLMTGIFQIKSRKKIKGLREESELENKDSYITGLLQGLATLPGLSRSGITVSTLLLRKFDDTSALRISFLMGLPIVLLGNIILNYQEFTLNNTAIYGLITAFVFGLLTIHGLMRLSKKINFGWFVIIFAVLMMLSVLI